MIQAALLSNLGVGELDVNGFGTCTGRDAATGMLWLVVIHAEPGGPVAGSVIRCDPGTMGRTLFHFRTTPRDGRHGLDYISLDGSVVEAGLPALSDLCAFIRTAWAEIKAGHAPDLEALAPLYLGLALPVPPVKPYAGPGDGLFRLNFGTPDEDGAGHRPA